MSEQKASEPQAEKIAFMPIPVTGLDLAFGPSNISKFLPSMSTIPKEFHRYGNAYDRLVSSIFFGGGSTKNWVAKDGIDKTTAINHFRSVLGSWAPKHEHKTAGCAYMLEQWFTPESLGIEVKP